MNATAVSIIENSGESVEEKAKSLQVSIRASSEQEPIIAKLGLFLEERRQIPIVLFIGGVFCAAIAILFKLIYHNYGEDALKITEYCNYLNVNDNMRQMGCGQVA